MQPQCGLRNYRTTLIKVDITWLDSKLKYFIIVQVDDIASKSRQLFVESSRIYQSTSKIASIFYNNFRITPWYHHKFLHHSLWCKSA